MAASEPTIALVDHDQAAPVAATSNVPEDDITRTSSTATGPSGIARKLTRASVKEGLARRKYAKWQPERFNDLGNSADTSRRSSVVQSDQSRSPSRGRIGGSPEFETENSTQTHPAGRDEGAPRVNGLETTTRDSEPASEIDILYENQRGWFFCGIPLYSNQSLLNFDPPPWVTKEFKDSPVNITNAQVPDPSWEWAWKTWYVDMGHDVDEQGWQYSFSFASRFTWHGTQPWFHSFVRRRRWLRKRIQRHKATDAREDDAMARAHKLNEDYFTIHSKTALHRDPSAGPATATRSRYSSPPRAAWHVDEGPPDEITDIPVLMKALKRAIVDREKIDIVRKFIQYGGDELYYLEEKMWDIMSMFVFHTSRRQLFESINAAIDETSKEQDADTENDKNREQERERKLNNLRRAADAAEALSREAEFWSDSKEEAERHELIKHSETSPSPSSASKLSGSIKGIPKEAGVGDEAHIY